MNAAVTLRPWRPDEVTDLAHLFRETVHHINIGDYTQAQIDAWAPEPPDLDRWREKLAGEQVIVAKQADELLGFCSWDATGYLDFLYVHHAWQGQGIASLLYRSAESSLRAAGLARIHAQVSVTAQPFFIRQGFRVVQHQVVRVREVDLPNAVMEKALG